MSTAGNAILVGLLGGMVGPDAKLTNSRDVILMALRANLTRSLSVAKIQEWLEMYFKAIGMSYKKNRTIYQTLKRLCDDGVAKRRGSGGYIAVPDDTDFLSGDFFLDIDAMEELKFFTNSNESLCEVIHSLSTVIIGDQGEGASIIKSLALIEATRNQDEFARLVKDVIKEISEYTEGPRFKGFGECPKDDLLEWTKRHGLVKGGKWFYVVRDIFSKGNANKTWIVSENRHPMFPPLESRKESYQNINASHKLLRIGTLEAIAVNKNGIREHPDYTFRLPNGAEVFQCDVCTIFGTFRCNKGSLCRLHAARSRNLSRAEYLDHLTLCLKNEILSGPPNKVVFGEYASRGHALRHGARLLKFRLANQSEISHFVNVSCLETRSRGIGITFTVRDIMCDVAGCQMVVYQETDKKEVLFWKNDEFSSLAYMLGSKNLKSQTYSIFSLFEEDAMHVCLGEVEAFSSNGKLLASYKNVTYFYQT